jgi:hypothetical protein
MVRLFIELRCLVIPTQPQFSTGSVMQQLRREILNIGESSDLSLKLVDLLS